MIWQMALKLLLCTGMLSGLCSPPTPHPPAYLPVFPCHSAKADSGTELRKHALAGFIPATSHSPGCQSVLNLCWLDLPCFESEDFRKVLGTLFLWEHQHTVENGSEFSRCCRTVLWIGETSQFHSCLGAVLSLLPEVDEMRIKFEIKIRL